MRRFDEVIKAAVSVLEKEKIQYMLVGAVAVSFYGVPRTSEDVDLVVVLPPESIPRFVKLLSDKGFSVSDGDVLGALREKSHFTVFDRESLFRLDVKGVYTKFDESSLSRRKRVKALGVQMWLCSPEDCILSKLEYGSPKDLSDAQSIIQRQGARLDKRYLTKEARIMGVASVLRRLMA